MRWSRVLRWGAVVLVAGFLVLQLIPYGRAHENLGTVREPPWDSPRTRELAVRACFDCHSNQTDWPWYSNVAPVSWYVQRHVEEGRGEVNFSEFGIGRQETSDTAEVVRNGTMPPGYYLPLHPSARLSDAEREELIRGFQATFGLRRGGTALPSPSPGR